MEAEVDTSTSIWSLDTVTAQPVLASIVVESVEHPMSQASQLAEDASSFRPRLEAGVDDPEVGSSCFGTRDLTVVIEIECLQGRFPIDITVLGLRIWGGLSVGVPVIVVHHASIADGGALRAASRAQIRFRWGAMSRSGERLCHHRQIAHVAAPRRSLTTCVRMPVIVPTIATTSSARTTSSQPDQ